MSAPKKPANAKAWDLRAKLQALAERGINGERDAAKIALARLEARIDFSSQDQRGPDLFAGVFHPATVAEPLMKFDDLELASFVKWAVEDRCKVECLFRDGALLAKVNKRGANKLAKIAETLAESFVHLWAQFSRAPGVIDADRAHFHRGLFDGCMGEQRDGPLPTRIAPPVKFRRSKKLAVASAPGLKVHPYTLALEFGKGIRCCAPLTSLVEELETRIQKALTQ